MQSVLSMTGELGDSGPMISSILATYFVFCILVAICGSQRRMGFLGSFFLSMFFTPVLALIVLLITGPSRRARVR
jgi:hypothetical protein